MAYPSNSRHVLFSTTLPKSGRFTAAPSPLVRSMPSIDPTSTAEREADAWADRILRKDDPESIQADVEPGAAPSIGHQSGLIENPAGGQPLPAPVKGLFESRFGHDFGRVRIHADTAAAESARALDAQAYTKGSHIVFGRDRYAPESVAGRRLLAHELAHVVQQHHGAGESVQRKPAEGKRFYSLEEMYGEEENRYLQYLYPEHFTSLRRDSALVMRAIWHAKSQEASVTFEYLLGGGPHGSAIPNLVREFFYRLVFRNVGLMNKGSATLKLRFVRTGLGLGGKSGERKIAEAARYLDMFLNNEQSLKRNKRVAIERADTTQVIGTSGEDKEIRVPVTELVFKIPELYEPTFPTTPAEQRMNRPAASTR